MSVIETDKLTKFYGAHRGIVEVDLAVEQGEVFGFLGPNGAGKTTTIRLLLDLIGPPPGARSCSEPRRPSIPSPSIGGSATSPASSPSSTG